jgi:8-oxo-dGTP pyrophosphatase MutT (NUDIX family)
MAPSYVILDQGKTMSTENPPIPDPTKRGSWTLRGAREIYDNPWIKLIEHDVLNPRGGEGIYGVVHMKSHALGVIPVAADGRIILVGQHRFSLNAYSWEIPEGGGALDIDPLISVARELQEETGLIAANWAHLQSFSLSNSVTDERGHLYLAWNLTQGPADPEETEDLQLKWVSFHQAMEMALAGDIHDIMTLTGLFRQEVMRQRGTLPEGFDPNLLDR